LERIQQIELEISRTQKNKVLDMAWHRRSWNYCADCGAASYFIGTVLSDTFSISSVWMQFFDMLTPMDLWHLAGFWFINGTGTIWYPFHLCPGRCSTARQRPNILESESPQLLNGGWNTAGKIMGDFARKSLIRGGYPLVN
jgi:hypothetical protein